MDRPFGRRVRSSRLQRLASQLSEAGREQLMEYLQLQLQIQALEARCAVIRRRLLGAPQPPRRHCARRYRLKGYRKGGRHAYH